MLGNSNKYNQWCGRMETLSAFDAFVQVNNGSGSGSGYGSGSGSGSVYGFGDGYGSGDGSGSGFGSGSGYGSGSGSGSVYGFGDGYGSGDGSGSGFGYGSGSGFGYGSGCGDGFGDGSGSGDGFCYGDGDGSGIKMFAGNQVYLIDRTPTLMYIVHGNIAKGAILKADLTTKPCYIVKNGNLFAHGRTLREAQAELIEKQFYNMDDDDRIDAFLKEIDINKQYPTSVFFDWHHKLTGSCEMGRRVFAENHGIDLENGTMTVGEFIGLTKDAYGGSIIKDIAERIKNAQSVD